MWRVDEKRREETRLSDQMGDDGNGSRAQLAQRYATSRTLFYPLAQEKERQWDCCLWLGCIQLEKEKGKEVQDVDDIIWS